MAGRATNEPTNYIALAKQSAKDVEGTSFYFLKHLDGSGFEVEESIQAVREGGSGQQVGFRFKDKVTSDGQAVGYARPQYVGQIMAAVLGQDTASVLAAASPLTNHFAAPAATLPYYTVEQYYGDVIERTTNVKFTAVDIEFEAGNPIKITPQFISGGSVSRRNVASALTPTRETAPPFFYPNASVVVNGGGFRKVTKGKISIKRGVDDGIYTVGLSREDVVESNLDVDLDFTAEYETSGTLYDYIHWAQGSVIPLDLATGSFNLFSRNGSFAFQIVDPLLQFVGAKLNKLDPDGKTCYIDVSAGDIGGTTAVFANTITSDVTGYLV